MPTLFDRQPWIRRALWIAVILAGVAFRAYMLHGLSRETEFCAADFLSFYSGGALAGTDRLYSPGAAFEVQERALGCHHQNLIFIKPPFYALLMKPFAQLPFIPAFYLIRVLILAGIAAFIWLWPGNRWGAAAACAWSIPMGGAFTVGQDVIFVLVAAMAAWRMLRRGRHFAAGLLFGLCGIKFHLLLLLPLFLIRWKLWKTVAGGCVAAAVWLAMCFPAAGPKWLSLYRDALTDSRMNPYPHNLVNLRGALGYGSPWIWPATLAVAGLCAYLIWKGTPEISLAAAFAGGVLVTPHATFCDGVLFVPGLLMALRLESPIARAAAFAALTPLYVLLPRGALQTIVVGLMLVAALTLRRQATAAAA